MNIKTKSRQVPVHRLTVAIDWITPKETMQLVGLKSRAIVCLRSEQWIEGIHFQRINARAIRYNRQALSHWLTTRHAPHLHSHWCREYLQALHDEGGNCV